MQLSNLLTADHITVWRQHKAPNRTPTLPIGLIWSGGGAGMACEVRNHAAVGVSVSCFEVTVASDACLGCAHCRGRCVDGCGVQRATNCGQSAHRRAALQIDGVQLWCCQKKCFSVQKPPSRRRKSTKSSCSERQRQRHASAAAAAGGGTIGANAERLQQVRMDRASWSRPCYCPLPASLQVLRCLHLY